MATYVIAASGGDYTTFAAMVAAINLAGDDIVEFRAAAAGGTATFDERLAPDASGTSGHQVTIRGRYGDTITVRGINGGGFDYYSVYNLTFRHESSANAYAQLLLTNCTNWLVQDVDFQQSYRGAVSSTAGANSNTFRCCTFTDTCYIDGGSQESHVFSVFGDDNLVESCTLGRSLDRFRFWGNNNRIIHNALTATDSVDFPSTSTYPHHTDDFQTFDNATELTQTLYAYNFSIDNTDSVGGTNAHTTNMQDDSDTGFAHFAFAFNVVARVGGGLFDFQNFNNVYIFNNTFVKIANGSASNFNTTGAWDLDTGAPQTSDVADARNNLWYNCPKCRDTDGLLSSDYWPTNFTSATNAAYNPSGAQCVLMTGASPANLAQADPVMDDPNNDDYSLAVTSPLIGAGSSGITASGAGTNSTSLTVNNSLRIWQDMQIKIGSGAYVLVSSVNYTTHVVTLAAQRSWSDTNTVLVKGMEDVGACPRSYYDDAVTVSLDNTTLPAGAVNLTATVSATDAVRKVEYLIDGVPLGSSTTSPYTVAYTADGAAHDVTARAYKAWASLTPYVDDTATLLASSTYRASGFRLTAV